MRKPFGLRIGVKLEFDYFFAGVVCVVLVPESTEVFADERESATVRPMEVTMKMIADHVVSLVRRLAAPRGPKAVCEPWPPKAPARSADLPCWRRTTPTRKRQTMTCRMTRRVTIGAALEPLCRKNDPENVWIG